MKKIVDPKKMKAAILVELNKPLIVAEVELPETLDCGQVLVRLKYSSICGSQIGEISGAKGKDNYLPHLLGHEGSAEVLEIGPGVKKVQPGDFVVLHWMKGSGIESNPPVYKRDGEQINAGWVTTFNEYAIVSENRLTPIPNWVDPKIAALFGCAVTTGLGAITNKAKLIMGESIIVFGVGGVGLNVIQGAKLASGQPIIGVDIYDSKLALARKAGATHLINSQRSDVKKEIAAILGNKGADVVIDNTGSPEVIQLAYELANNKGRVILIGVPRKENNISIYSLPLHFGKVITGTHGGETNPSEDIPRYLNLLKAGVLRLQELITDEFKLPDINKAIELMRTGQIAGRCIIGF